MSVSVKSRPPSSTHRHKRPARTALSPPLSPRAPRPSLPRQMARSRWLDTRVILLIRLASAAFLLAHAVFFALHRDLGPTNFAAWTFVHIAVAFLLAVLCSLLHVVATPSSPPPSSPVLEGQSVQAPNRLLYHSADDPIASLSPDLEKQTCHPSSLDHHLTASSDSDSASASASAASTCTPRSATKSVSAVALAVYQSAVTAAVFSTLLYVIALRRPMRYHDIVHVFIAPLLLLADVLLTCMVRFYIRAVPLALAFQLTFAAVYAVKVFAQKRTDLAYFFIDRDVLSHRQFVMRVVLVAVAALIAPFAIYLAARLPYLLCAGRRRHRRGASTGVPKKRKRDAHDSASSASSHDVHEAPPAAPTAPAAVVVVMEEPDMNANVFPLDAATVLDDRPRGADSPLRDEPSSARLTAVEDEVDEDGDAAILGARDRLGKPLRRVTSANSTGSAGSDWRRSLSGMIQASPSGSSMASDGSVPRPISERHSSWTALEAPLPRVESEYFRMPAVLDAQGLPRDAVLLPRVPSSVSRSSSQRSLPGTSGLFPRVLSGRGASSSGSASGSVSAAKPPSQRGSSLRISAAQQSGSILGALAAAHSGVEGAAPGTRYRSDNS